MELWNYMENFENFENSIIFKNCVNSIFFENFKNSIIFEKCSRFDHCFAPKMQREHQVVRNRLKFANLNSASGKSEPEWSEMIQNFTRKDAHFRGKKAKARKIMKMRFAFSGLETSVYSFLSA